MKICLRFKWNAPDNILQKSAGVAKLDKRRNAHLLNYMYKKKQCIELLDIKNVNTRARAATLFKTIIPNCEKKERSVLYKGAVEWNSLQVIIRNIDTYHSFKNLQKYAFCK